MFLGEQTDPLSRMIPLNYMKKLWSQTEQEGGGRNQLRIFPLAAITARADFIKPPPSLLTFNMHAPLSESAHRSFFLPIHVLLVQYILSPSASTTGCLLGSV